MSWLEKFIGELLNTELPDLLLKMNDGAMASFIGFGITLSVFALKQYHQHCALKLSSKRFRRYIDSPKPIIEIPFFERCDLYDYRNQLSLIKWIKGLFPYYLIAAGLLLISWLWDSKALTEMPYKYTWGYKLTYCAIHNALGVLVLVAYSLLLIYYVIWFFKPQHQDFREYSQIYLYYLRRARYLLIAFLGFKWIHLKKNKTDP